MPRFVRLPPLMGSPSPPLTLEEAVDLPEAAGPARDDEVGGGVAQQDACVVSIISQHALLAAGAGAAMEIRSHRGAGWFGRPAGNLHLAR